MTVKMEMNACEPDGKSCSFCGRSLGVVGALLGPTHGPSICEDCANGVSTLFACRAAAIKEARDIVAAKEADGTYNQGEQCDCPACTANRLLDNDAIFTEALAKLAAISVPAEDNRAPDGVVLQ